MYTVRGATTIELDEINNILKFTDELLKKMIEENNIDLENIISIIFTCTKDIKSAYPAKAARDMGIVYAGILCFQEMEVMGSLDRCIRILMFVNDDKKQREVKHIFLRDAVDLRPDLKRGF